MMFTSIIKIVEHKIWDKFYLKLFFMRSIIFEIEDLETTIQDNEDDDDETEIPERPEDDNEEEDEN